MVMQRRKGEEIHSDLGSTGATLNLNRPEGSRDLSAAGLELGYKVAQHSPQMGGRFTIGEVAKAAGVPTSTVRYYERARLLRPSARTASNYRLYSKEDLGRLRFIRAAQATGFTLDDIRQLLRPAPCSKVQGLIEERLAQVAARIRDLQHVQRVLKSSLELCHAHEETGRCAVIETLSTSARAPRAHNRP
ncbi:MAG: heavy metal-responsive transcriptional regulator [Myxococcota bacterium]